MLDRNCILANVPWKACKKAFFELVTMKGSSTAWWSRPSFLLFVSVFAIASVFVTILSFAGSSGTTSLRAGGASSPFYTTRVEDASGNQLTLANLVAHPNTPPEKLYLVTNVASKCGLTKKNYAELQQLYVKYQDRGLEVLGFPCRDFKEQEFTTNEEIQAFAKSQGATFQVFGRVGACSGASPETHPLFQYLIRDSGGGNLEWNFTKFLVDGRTGKVKARYHPKQAPMSFEADVVKFLDEIQGTST